MKFLMPEANYYQRMPVYLLLAIATGLFIMYGSKLIKNLWNAMQEKRGKQIRSLFVIEDIKE